MKIRKRLYVAFLQVEGVSSTRKMQILRTKFVLMRKEYNQEEEKDLQNTAKKYTHEEM